MNKEDIDVQWHPAFTAALQIHLEEYRDILQYEEEHLLNKEPLRIDVLIVKKEKGAGIQNDIGEFFLNHNIIEYKSPEDYISINDFYKVIGYACLYLADTECVDEIKASEISITFVSSSYPREMMKKVQARHGIQIIKHKKGIYYLTGASCIIQI